MAFIELKRDAFENVSVSLRPKIHYISSSIGEGVTGSEYVAPVRSKCIKSIDFSQDLLDKATAAYIAGEVDVSNSNPAFDESDAGYVHLLGFLADSVAKGTVSDEYLSTYLDRYMSAVNDRSPELRFSKKLEIFRFDPSFKFEPPGGLNLTIKNNIRNILMNHHKHRYQDCGYYYRNYNTVNFFTASNLPASASLMYPDKSNEYIPEGPFGVAFWINPRYHNYNDQDYHAGTLLHLSSSICVSLISGSQKDSLDQASTYKVMLQLSHSADIPPSKVDFSHSNWPQDLIFTSSKELSRNHWHHVAMTWGGKYYQNYTGSIYVDDHAEQFIVPSSSISTNSTNSDGSALFVGNFYDGPSTLISKFFNQSISGKEGVLQLDSGADDPDPTKYNLTHMLNAEFHELKLFNTYLSSSAVDRIKASSPTETGNMLFYLPPYFYPQTPSRDIIQTPFQKLNTGSNDPFNVAFSFGVGGKEINADNFVKDFKTTRFPRLFFMTASTIDTTIQNITADDYVYASGSILRRNFLILPNDNGLFKPDYGLLKSQATGSLSASFAAQGESIDYGIINLENLVPESSLYPGLIQQTGSILDEIMGASPENPGVVPGAVLTIAQRTRDTSSHEIVIYNISNLYYGNRIHPTSFHIIEPGLTGSRGKLKFNIRDNGRGLLYRADSETPHADWAGLGNIFYDEGVAIIKTPHLPYINKDKTEIKFRGEHNIHALTINVPVSTNILNKSTSSNFHSLPPSDNISDSDLESIQLTSVNIHDENFNIIMRANFSQPIIKTAEDEFIVRLKEDF